MHDQRNVYNLREPAPCALLPQAGKLAFDFSEGLVVGLRLPDGAEREVLRTKWADFSGNISSYVVCAYLTHWLRASRGRPTCSVHWLWEAGRCTVGLALAAYSDVHRSLMYTDGGWQA